MRYGSGGWWRGSSEQEWGVCEGTFICSSILLFHCTPLSLQPSLVKSKANSFLLGLSLGETTGLMMDSLPFNEPEFHPSRIHGNFLASSVSSLCSLSEKNVSLCYWKQTKSFHFAFWACWSLSVSSFLFALWPAPLSQLKVFKSVLGIQVAVEQRTSLMFSCWTWKTIRAMTGRS